MHVSPCSRTVALSFAARTSQAQRLKRGLMLMLTVITLAAALLPRATLAHEGPQTGFASMRLDGRQVHYALTLPSMPSLPGDPAGAIASPDYAALARHVAGTLQLSSGGERCTMASGGVRPPSPPRVAVTVDLTFDCPAIGEQLELRTDVFDRIGRSEHILVRFDSDRPDQAAQQLMLADETRDARFVTGVNAGAGAALAISADGSTAPVDANAPGVGEFVWLGIEHILIGWDHLLFILALVLPGGSAGSLIRTITAFTVAHSITLGLAATGLVSVPSGLVEALIALSIAWVAAENLFSKRPLDRRWQISFLFGLIHGFGFSNVLREIGLPKDSLLLALLNFNIGVELGQLLVIALLLPLLALMRRVATVPVPRVLSAIVMVSGAVLFATRLV